MLISRCVLTGGRRAAVGNIPYDATEEQLLAVCEEVGPVVSLRLVKERETGKPKGYGFCEYRDEETAQSARRNLQGYEVNGRQLRVDFAENETSAGGGGGAADDGRRREVQVTRDGLLAFCEGAKIFIHYLSATANDICREHKRQTISADDVFKAITELDFPEFLDPLRETLENFRKENLSRKEEYKRRSLGRKRKVEEEEGAGLDGGEDVDGAREPVREESETVQRRTDANITGDGDDRAEDGFPNDTYDDEDEDGSDRPESPVEHDGLPSAATPGQEVDRTITEALKSGQGLYAIDTALLERLRPTVILTQSLCSVCAIDYSLVSRIASCYFVVRQMDVLPKLVSLNPGSVEDIIQDVVRIGDAVGLSHQALAAAERLKQRVEMARSNVKASVLEQAAAPKVVFMEWTDPIFCGGHWTPQLIEMAGGQHPLNPCKGQGRGAGESFRVSPEQVVAVDPDWIIKELEAVSTRAWWRKLRAVKNDHIVLVDGNHMFNRSGPRIIDALEWLVAVLNDVPKLIPADFPWEKWVQPSQEKSRSRGPDESQEEGHPLLLDQTSEEFLSTETWVQPECGKDVEDAHTAACQAGSANYTDPQTGFAVFTERALQERGVCCGNRCRHCPYGHFNLPLARGPPVNIIKLVAWLAAMHAFEVPFYCSTFIQKTTYLVDSANTISQSEDGAGYAQEWTGDVSSLLMLQIKDPESQLDQLPDGCTCLVTCFETSTGRIVERQADSFLPRVLPVSLRAIMSQAKHLRAPLLAVAVNPGDDSERLRHAVQAALELTPCKEMVEKCVSTAEESQLTKLWPILALGKVEVKLVVSGKGVMAGIPEKLDTYNSSFVRGLHPGLDPLGGDGTFFTYIVFHDSNGVTAAPH
eukprot:SM000140S00608  [mRNA]  locus=s140:151582:159394:- [translate_table: standard]